MPHDRASPGMLSENAEPDFRGAASVAPHALKHPAPASLGFDGQSEAVRQLRDRLDACLPSLDALMLCGEAGSGRTRAARYLWVQSARPGRFVPVIDRLSFEEALADQAGCLFIGEIGLVEPGLQASLLLLLCNKPANERPVVICTSTWAPARLVQDRRMDEALATLLSRHCVTVPAMRERHDDIGALCAVWAEQNGGEAVFHPDCAAWLAQQDWPGNFRQIRQLLSHAAQSRAGGVVTAARLAALHRVDTTADAASFQGLLARYLPSMLDLESDVQGSLHARVLAEVERPLFRLVLRATEGNQIRAAALLGINRNTLRKRLQLLGIETGRTRS